MKKILSVVLAVVLLVGVMPMSSILVSAETYGDFIYYEEEGYIWIEGYVGDGGDVIIPSEINGYPVDCIDYWAFAGCTSITSVTIPGSVYIFNGAFENCTNLKSVMLSEGLITICPDTFAGCTSLTNITLPDSVEYIGEGAFRNCTSLKSIEIPNNVTNIGAAAFSDCTSLVDITLPDWLPYIGEDAFNNTGYLNDESNWENDACYLGKALIKVKKSISGEFVIKEGTNSLVFNLFNNCLKLTSVKIPYGVTEIPDFTFYNCVNLTDITIPHSVTSIGAVAFFNCISLEKITIPDSVEYVGGSAFENCVSLKNIVIPDDVTQIYSYTFSGCYHLTNITIPVGVTSIGENAFYCCYNLENITIPDSVVSIQNDAFNNCLCLENITLPYGVAQIASGAFVDCISLKSIAIPDSVTSMGYEVFVGCDSLTDIYYSGTEEEWNALQSDEGYFPDATVHFSSCECGGTLGEWITDTEPSCVAQGRKHRICSGCEKVHYRVIDTLGHKIENGVCTVCGKEIAIVESDHNYADDTNKSWTVNYEWAQKIILKFSADTETEYGYDYIHIYDGSGSIIGVYTGTELASKTITVEGNKVEIRLVSDETSNFYGFYAEVYAVYIETGDLNVDGVINAGDLTVLRQFLLSGASGETTDINGDGVTNIIDLVALKKMLG